ncbi:MAG: hypothetical protein AAB364_00250 [Patescibacteria group bacterium]
MHRLLHRLTGLGRRVQPALPMKKVEARVLFLSPPVAVTPVSAQESPANQIVLWTEVIQEQLFYLDLSSGETAARNWPISGIEAPRAVTQCELLQKEFSYTVEAGQIVSCRLFILDRDDMTNDEIVRWLALRGARPARAVHLLKFMSRYHRECPLNGRFLGIADGTEDKTEYILALGKWSTKKILNLFFFPAYGKHEAGDIVLALVG